VGVKSVVKALGDAGAQYVIATEQKDLAARVQQITGSKGARVVFNPIGGPGIARLAECMVFGHVCSS